MSTQQTATPERPDLSDRLEQFLSRRGAALVGPARRLVNRPATLVAAILAIIAACSAAYALLEDKGPVESLWWAVVTGSTVGYGDFYPESTAGRGVATFLIVAMLVLVPIAIGHVIARLVSDRNQFTHDEQVALARTIESVHDHVDRLELLILSSLRATHGQAWLEEQVARLDAVRREEGSEADGLSALFHDHDA